MQLIQLIEPTAIDIKNKMSELGEAIEHIQINSGIADIKNDVSGKISPNKKDTVSHTNESINGNNSIKEQLEDEVKDLNGIVKPNSDAQMLSIDNYNSETENNVSIDNESTAIGQSNGSLSLSEPLKITNSNLTNTTVDGNINVDNDTIDLNKNLNSSEKEEVIVDSNKGDSSLNVKEIPDVISSENLPSVIDTQAPASSEEVCVAEKLKGIEVSIENKNMAPNAPAFSPNSDTNEEVNISAQLQQLENDPSIEKGSIGDIIPDTDLKILTEIESNTFENKSQIKIEVPTFNNDKTTSPVKSEQNQILINSAEKKDTSGASEVDTKLPPIPDLDDKHEDDSIRMNMDLDIAPTDDKPDNNSDISFEGIPLVEKIPEDKSSMDVVNEDISNELSEKLVPVEAIVEQSTIESGIDMEVDDFKPNNEHKLESKREDKVDKPIDEKTLNSSKTENADVEKKASVQKYVTVKKFTDMAYPSAPTNGNVEATKNIEFTDILDGNLSQIDQNQQNQIMEVDATDKVFLITPEHGVTLYSSDKHSLVQKTEVENNIEITNKITIEDKTMEESSQDSIEKEVMTIEQQDIDSSVMEIDSAAMKINDSEIVPVVEKSKFDNVDQDKTEKTVAHNKISEKSKDNAVINIIDNEDEEPIKNNTQELSIMKNNNASEVISIDDSVKYAISEESHKPFTEVEIVNEADLNNVKEGKVQKNEKPVVKQLPVVCKLSNTMDILSDEEDDLHVAKPSEENKALNVNSNTVEEQNKCINLDDDDDIMFIEDTNSQDANLVEENKAEQLSDDKTKSQTIKTTDSKTDPDSAGNQINSNKSNSSKPPENEVPQIPQGINFYFII